MMGWFISFNTRSGTAVGPGASKRYFMVNTYNKTQKRESNVNANKKPPSSTKGLVVMRYVIVFSLLISQFVHGMQYHCDTALGLRVDQTTTYDEQEFFNGDSEDPITVLVKYFRISPPVSEASDQETDAGERETISKTADVVEVPLTKFSDEHTHATDQGKTIQRKTKRKAEAPLPKFSHEHTHATGQKKSAVQGKTSPKSKQYYCEICSPAKSFSSVKDRNDHLKSGHEEYLQPLPEGYYMCRKCKAKFDHGKYILRHMMTPTVHDKQFVCRCCENNSFGSLAALYKHYKKRGWHDTKRRRKEK